MKSETKIKRNEGRSVIKFQGRKIYCGPNPNIIQCCKNMTELRVMFYIMLKAQDYVVNYPSIRVKYEPGFTSSNIYIKPSSVIKDNTNSVFYNTLNVMMNRLIVFVSMETGGIVSTNMIKEWEKIDGGKYVRIEINKEMFDFILNFKGYKLLYSDVLFKMKRRASVIMYFIMSGSKSDYNPVYELEDLKRELLVNCESSYKNSFMFRTRVLDVMKDELDKVSPWSFTYKEIKNGISSKSPVKAIRLFPVKIEKNIPETKRSNYLVNKARIRRLGKTYKELSPYFVNPMRLASLEDMLQDLGVDYMKMFVSKAEKIKALSDKKGKSFDDLFTILVTNKHNELFSGSHKESDSKPEAWVPEKKVKPASSYNYHDYSEDGYV